MSIDNPFNVRETYQDIAWNSIPTRKNYCFELILPLKALSFRWRDKDTHYIMFPAEAMEDWTKEGMLWMKKGTMCLLRLPVKTLETSWMTVPPYIRNQLTEEDNLNLRFDKKTKQCMVINFAERKQPTDEQIAFATEQYQAQNELMARIGNRSSAAGNQIKREEY
jgi:hypothetical protein